MWSGENKYETNKFKKKTECKYREKWVHVTPISVDVTIIFVDVTAVFVDVIPIFVSVFQHSVCCKRTLPGMVYFIISPMLPLVD